MKKNEPDLEADFSPDFDAGEMPSQMEPLVLSSDSRHRTELTDLALELIQKSAQLQSSLPVGVTRALAQLVRTMNCYYSNQIEGHNTHPIDIERAMNNDYSDDVRKRNLQLEAKAHISVQSWIDAGGLSKGRAVQKDGILEIHKRFSDDVPKDLLVVEDPSTAEKFPVVPGVLRTRYVQVGTHAAVSPGAVPRLLNRFEEVYSKLGTSETILAVAAAHHRLLWIHPFLDGNGRVARLMSYAQLFEVLKTGGIWSIARGLARNEAAYKQGLMMCDQQRQNDLDGRGNLSEEALAAFTKFFLGSCLDQVQFMEGLIRPDLLHGRILSWASEQPDLLPSAGAVLEAVLFRGELPRGEVPRIVGQGDRQARRVVSGLIAKDVLIAATDRAPLRLAFPAALAPKWMPGLFPDKLE